MTSLSRSGFWVAAAATTALVVLMLILLFGSSDFGTETTLADGRTRSVTVTCASIARGARPLGYQVLGSYSGADGPVWGIHCATIRTQRSGWMALLAVPTAVLAVLCLVRRPGQLIGTPRRKPQLGPMFTPHIQ